MKEMFWELRILIAVYLTALAIKVLRPIKNPQGQTFRRNLLNTLKHDLLITKYKYQTKQNFKNFKNEN